jgi:hypothetical protein
MVMINAKNGILLLDADERYRAEEYLPCRRWFTQRSAAAHPDAATAAICGMLAR